MYLQKEYLLTPDWHKEANPADDWAMDWVDMNQSKGDNKQRVLTPVAPFTNMV